MSPRLLLAAACAAALAACTTTAETGTEATAPAASEPAAETAPAPAATGLDAAIQGAWRDPKNSARDPHRHPAETLAFFGIEAGDTVVEITPGGGWYAEILAPYLRDGGQYVGAVVDPMALPEGKARDYPQRNKSGLETKFAGDAAQYGKARIVGFSPKVPSSAPPVRRMPC